MAFEILGYDVGNAAVISCFLTALLFLALAWLMSRVGDHDIGDGSGGRCRHETELEWWIERIAVVPVAGCALAMLGSVLDNLAWSRRAALLGAAIGLCASAFWLLHWRIDVRNRRQRDDADRRCAAYRARADADVPGYRRGIVDMMQRESWRRPTHREAPPA